AQPRKASWSVMFAGQYSTLSGHCFSSSAGVRLRRRTLCPCRTSSETAACPITPVPPVTNTFIAAILRSVQHRGRLGATYVRKFNKMSDRSSLGLVNSGDIKVPEPGGGESCCLKPFRHSRFLRSLHAP